VCSDEEIEILSSEERQVESEIVTGNVGWVVEWWMDRAAEQHWMVVEVLQMVLKDEKEVVGVPSHVRDHPFEMKVVHEELPP
jgi:hypothetical protein